MSDETRQLACFVVGAEEYALDIMRIKEIINPVKVTQVPRSPTFVEGIIELRGAFLPVVDLRKRFDLPPMDTTRDTKYIIVALEGRIVGLVVDKVIEVRRIDAGSVSDAPEMAIGDTQRFFNGVAKWDERIVMLMNLDEILSPEEKQQLLGMQS